VSAKKITIDGFLDEFKSRHDQMPDRPFCWVLGSGASMQSGIPTGGAFVEQWLKELHRAEDFDDSPIEEWATAENLGIPDFDFERASHFYPWIYHRRFVDYKEKGYAFLENAMNHAEPSFGYSVLAQIMATTAHKVAITTNFDNLAADALSIYTRTFPLVCGHESLTGYIRANLRRPLVAKIHRDLLLAPLSDPDEIAKLPGEWAGALTKIFDRFTPIVIGYGGNDGSLMGFLKTVAPIEGGIFWCYRGGSEIDSEIDKVVEHHHGRLVPIAGFDEIMLQFQEKLQLPFLLPQLQSAHDQRVANYQKQFEALTATLSKPAESPRAEEVRKPVRKAAEAAVERLTKEKDWWAWQLKAKAEPDATKREAIYREALQDFPNSANLMACFAVFIEKEKESEKRSEAAVLYARAYELDPNDSLHVGNLAWCLHDYHKDSDEAERLYRKALELNGNNSNATWNFALFMKDVRKDYDEAERLFRRAVEIEPNNARRTGSFAFFMHTFRKNFDEAERYYRKSAEIDPTNANNAGNFAQFLAAMGRIDEAGDLLVRAWGLTDETPSQVRAEIAFTRWLLARASNRDGGSALERLKTLLQEGFRRMPGSFDHLLTTFLPRLPENERSLSQRLGDAILDETRVTGLDDEPLWIAAIPVALTVPWTD